MNYRSKAGDPCWKKVELKIIIAEFEQTKHFHAKPNMAYTSNDIDQMLLIFADQIEKTYPQIEFRMVQIGPNKFNFIAEGVRDGNERDARGSGDPPSRSATEFSDVGDRDNPAQSDCDGPTDCNGAEDAGGNRQAVEDPAQDANEPANADPG